MPERLAQYQSPPPTRRGRHGCRVRGVRRAAREKGGAEAPQRRPSWIHDARALLARGAHGCRDQSPERLPGVRRGRRRGRDVPRDGAARRAVAGAAAGGRPAPRGGNRQHRARPPGGARRAAREAAGASGRETSQSLSDTPRREAARLRPDDVCAGRTSGGHPLGHGRGADLARRRCWALRATWRRNRYAATR